MVAVSLKKFFFKQKTAYEIGGSDWSSDVCSSDLEVTMTANINGKAVTSNTIYKDIMPVTQNKLDV